MEADDYIAKKTSASEKSYFTYEDVVLTFSSQYAETKSDLVNLLNPNLELGTKQGWNSGNHAPAWIKISLKEYAFVEEIELIVNILPSCEVSYVCEIEVVHDLNQTKRKIVDETNLELHWLGKRIKVKVGQRMKSFMVKTIKSESWIAWSRILLIK